MTFEIVESIRIAFMQIRAHKMRSVLTALGVIIGIIAVTLMGSAIGGIETGFENSLAVIGDDILYVEKWPWRHVDDWWNYRNRRVMDVRYAERLKRIIEATPNSELVTAVPTMNTMRSVKYGNNVRSAARLPPPFSRTSTISARVPRNALIAASMPPSTLGASSISGIRK